MQVARVSAFLFRVLHANVHCQRVDAAGGDFHLSGDSPLLAYTPEALGYYQDIEGHYFALGGMKDIGVYAETVFSDGFDGN